jgi:hypothetical protein
MAEDREMAAIANCARFLMDRGTKPMVIRTSLVNLLVGVGKSELALKVDGLMDTAVEQWIVESERKIKAESDNDQFVRLARRVEIHKRVTSPNA